MTEVIRLCSPVKSGSDISTFQGSFTSVLVGLISTESIPLNLGDLSANDFYLHVIDISVSVIEKALCIVDAVF